jgi:hypothetical protein
VGSLSRAGVETVVDPETAADAEPIAQPVAEPDDGAAQERAARGPFVLVGLAVAFNLWVLRGETVPTQTGNDSNLHESMVRWALHNIELKQSAIDGWFPDFGLGFPQFHQYQSLPHIITGYVSRLFGEPDTYAWSLYLLLALWPICVFVCVRLFGLSSWSAAAAAVSPLLVAGPASAFVLVGYGYEFGSYIWKGHGLWAQLWGMWLLPLSLALSWRAIARRQSMTLAAVVTGLTIACHLITGYLALIAVVLWVVLVPSQLSTRLVRGLIVGAGSLLVVLWMLVPFLTDQKFAVYASLRGSIWNDSYGARKILEWLVTGELFDSGRFPVITILVGIGAIVCVTRWRRDEASRAVLAFFALGLLLVSGRPTLGAIADVVPGADELYFPRFIIAVHLGGIILAGIGSAWIGETVIARVRRSWSGARVWALAGAAAVVFVAVLAPAWTERFDYADFGRRQMEFQRAQDATDGAELAALIEKTRGQNVRVYAGLSTRDGKNYRIGYVPVFAELVNRGVDTFGFALRVSALSTAVEPQFTPLRASHLDLFNVGYAILPAGIDPPPTATLVASAGRHRLWKLSATTGYLEVVDTVGPPIVADNQNLGGRVQGWLASSQIDERRFPTVAFDGAPAAAPTLAPGQTVTGPAGQVLGQFVRPADGYFGGQVHADRPAVVLLKSTFHPRWGVTVDGRPAPTEFIAPSFVGVKVPAGDHTVVFQYRRYPDYLWLFVLAGMAIVALLVADQLLNARDPDADEDGLAQYDALPSGAPL